MTTQFDPRSLLCADPAALASLSPADVQDLRGFHLMVSIAGSRGGIEWLNARSRFRFTELCRIGGLREIDKASHFTLELYDRENPTLRFSGDVPLHGTWCEAMLSDRGLLPESLTRLHALAGNSAGTYYGVPLLNPRGGVCGTLCHYDHRPRVVSDACRSLLDAAAPYLAHFCG
jgi:hypothetical protein